VPREVSKAIDLRTRALQKAVIEGVLSVPEQQLRETGGLQELTALFSQPESARQLMAVSASPVGAGAGDAFGQACAAVEAIEGMADFLFAALSVPRPAGMDLPSFIRIGMAVRRQAGIDGLERVLVQTPAKAAQEALRNHALHALRRAQQRLLTQVLQQTPVGVGADAPASSVEQVMSKLNGARNVTPAEAQGLEQAVLAVWALSEAVSPSSDAA
jgi:glutamate dehydrogenase